jgi:hypothetical protein
MVFLNILSRHKLNFVRDAILLSHLFDNTLSRPSPANFEYVQ